MSRKVLCGFNFLRYFLTFVLNNYIMCSIHYREEVITSTLSRLSQIAL